MIGCAVLALAEIGLQADRELEVGQRRRVLIQMPAALNCRCARNMSVYRNIAVSINFLINYGPVRWKGVVLAFLVYIRVAIKVVGGILDKKIIVYEIRYRTVLYA